MSTTPRTPAIAHPAPTARSTSRHRSPGNRLRQIGLVPVVAALATSVFTVTAVLVGPEPRVPQRSSVLNDPSLALHEPTDRIVLVGWWLIALFMALVTIWLLRRQGRAYGGVASNRAYSRVVFVLGTSTIGLMIVSIVSGWYGTSLWPGTSLLGLLIGLAFAVFTAWMWQASNRFAAAATVATVGLVLVFAIPMLVQTPGRIGDPYHFEFTSDEISAVAAGRFPLSDYIPQYSVLLGFPIAPVLHVLGSHAIFGVIAWLLLLQAVALIAAVMLPALVGGWKMLAPASVVVVLPVLAMVAPFSNAASYFAVTPMRVVLPSLTLVMAFLVLRNQRRAADAGRWWRLLLGVAAGLTTLNNPDYGLPAGLAVFVVVIIASPSRRDKALSAGLVLVGMSLPFVAYGISGSILGRPVQWSHWLFFQRTFGAEGTNAQTMAPFGLHIAIVTLFVSAAVVGVGLMVKGRPYCSGFAYRQGVLLALVGGWSLLSLPYFASRSGTATLVGGHAYQVGMVVAAFLPLLRVTLCGFRLRSSQRSLGSVMALCLGALAVAGTTSAIVFVRPASNDLGAVRSGSLVRFPALDEQTRALERILDSRDGVQLRRLVEQDRVRQALTMANLTGLAVGIPSGSVVSNPGYYELSPVIADAQCVMSLPAGVDYLVVSRRSAVILANEVSCATRFQFRGARRYVQGDFDYVLLHRVA